MNVYSCWYHGNFGYGCRTRGRKWIFVPELGQPDKNIYRNLYLDDLVFKNSFDKKFEADLENGMRKPSVSALFVCLLIARRKPQTVGGLLFSVH